MASRFHPKHIHDGINGMNSSSLLFVLSADVLEFMAAVRVRLIFSTNQSNRDEYNAFATASRAEAATWWKTRRTRRKTKIEKEERKNENENENENEH